MQRLTLIKLILGACLQNRPWCSADRFLFLTCIFLDVKFALCNEVDVGALRLFEPLVQKMDVRAHGI